ncbi:peptide deformylase [Rhizobium sp. MHM7A]|uniref:peptide deformylase n=1 Tax=Rhizobium sp. MHM7A TaxID=2583233 RepID=UPI00110629C3|nr:peptide deformylase [Rhizobium sp. MHM7A]TLX16173.1 peptide deformylase [Rhizobium sp. MHM7A]
MHKRNIINLTDPRLRQISEPVLVFDAALQELAKDMITEMERARGIGLAAVQLGELRRVIVTCAANSDGNGTTHVLVNPVITSRSEDRTETSEGCLSIPGVRLAFSRPSTITVDYVDLTGAPHTLVATGMLATCIQHEIDHLDGILILDHVSKLRRDRAITAFKKVSRMR